MAARSRNEVREAVAVFYDSPSLDAAIDELESSGFDRAQLSLVAGHKAVEQTLGHMYDKVAEIEDDAEVPRTCYVARESVGDAKGSLLCGLAYVGAVAAAGAIVASGGAITGAIVGAAMAGSAGALVGSVLGRIVEDRHADYLQEQLDRGGILLWVSTPDAAAERTAIAVLRKHSGHDVHVHALPAPAV